jgi:hypothetical protein
MEGGGLCWDETSCVAGNEVIGGITNALGQSGIALAHHFVSGYDESTFKSWWEHPGLLDRERANNPFKDASYVYIPYCTGDFHSGSTTMQFKSVGKTAHFAGRQNLDLFLAKLVAAFPEPERMMLAGSSAGGYGALINYWHVREAFGNKRLDLISDSSPALWMKAPIFSGIGTWNTGAALPPGCPECKGDVRGLYAYYSKTYPDSRFAVTSNDQDLAISTGGYAITPFPQFYNAIRNLSDSLAPLPNLKMFVAQSTVHGLLSTLDVATRPLCCTSVAGQCVPHDCGTKGTVFGDWITKMETDDPTWKTETSFPH